MHNFSSGFSKMAEGSPAKRSSSHKVDLLYLEFENLKARIHTSTSKKKEYQSINSSSMAPNLSHKKNGSLYVKQQGARNLHNIKVLDKTQFPLNDACNFFKIEDEQQIKSSTSQMDLKQCIKKSIESFISDYFLKLQREVSIKMEHMTRRIKISDETIKKIKMILSMKNTNLSKIIKIEPISVKIKDTEDVSDIVFQYEQKISELIEDYERRIEDAQQKGKDNETYSSTIRSRQINTYQKESLQKQTEINKLKLNYHKLKRNFEQTKQKYQACLHRIQQMEFKALARKDTSIQVENLNQSETIKLKQQIQLMKNEISLKNIHIQKLNQELKKHDQKQQHKKVQQSTSVINQKEQISNVPITQDCKKAKDDKFYIDLDQIEADFSILDDQFTKSQIIKPKRKKDMLSSLKSLELEVNLMTEENKHLQYKKVLFQNQLKNTEQDEQRFVQQSNILKEQIKRLNSTMQLLDKILYQFIKDGKFDNLKIDEIPQELKSRALILAFTTQNQKKK